MGSEKVMFSEKEMFPALKYSSKTTPPIIFIFQKLDGRYRNNRRYPKKRRVKRSVVRNVVRVNFGLPSVFVFITPLVNVG